MLQHLEAVFENGLLRPLEPLALVDKQHVFLTITGLAGQEPVSERSAEMEWLARNRSGYRGPWVALQGESLLSHGSDGRAVRDEARRRGFLRPLLVHIPEDPDMPSAGWL
jgi:predicted DNA-binding antitoxin AbrB/MazE fold protein